MIRLIHSRDIAERLRKMNYGFSPFEAIDLIHEVRLDRFTDEAERLAGLKDEKKDDK